MIVAAGDTVKVVVWGLFRTTSTPSFDFVNKSGQKQTFNTGRISGTFAEFIVPGSLMTSENLPATADFKVNGVIVKTEKFELASTPTSPGGSTEVSDESISAILNNPDSLSRATVDGIVAESVDSHVPGIELGYAERVSNYAVTNMASNITGLSVTVVGQGRPVDVEFFCTQAYHSVADTNLTAQINMNAAQIASATVKSFSTSAGPAVYCKRRILLTAGTSYNFVVGITQSAAGTQTWWATAGRPMFLSVVSR